MDIYFRIPGTCSTRTLVHSIQDSRNMFHTRACSFEVWNSLGFHRVSLQSVAVVCSVLRKWKVEAFNPPQRVVEPWATQALLIHMEIYFRIPGKCSTRALVHLKCGTVLAFIGCHCRVFRCVLGPSKIKGGSLQSSRDSYGAWATQALFNHMDI